MYGPLLYLTAIVGFAVLGVVLTGVWNMGRGGDSANLSQKLMRWRVGLQFVAIVVAMLAIAVARH